MAKLQGVWATSKTLEECSRELERSHRGLDCIEAEIWSSNTPIGEHSINASAEPVSIAE